MSTLAKLLVSLGLDAGDYHKGLQDSAQATDTFSKGLMSVGTVAVAAGAIAGAALVGVGVAGVKAFASFQTGMSEVFTLLPGMSASAMGDMSKDVKDFAKAFGVLPEKEIPALYQALSAGVPKDNVFDFLATAQKAAVGGVTDLEVAVDGISSVVNAYGATVVGASKASDLMFTTVKLGKTNFEQLASSLFNVIPTAASLGVSFEDVSAAMASITLQGTPTSVATTELRAALVEASKGGTKLDAALKGLTGKSFPQLIAGGMDIGTIFNTLRSSMPDQQFKDLFGSVEGLNAVLAITGPNAKNFASNLDAMKNSAGATDLAYQTMNQTIGASVNKLKAFGAVFLIDIGEKLAPAVALFTNALISLLNSQAVTTMIENLGNGIAFVVGWIINASQNGIPQFNTALTVLSAIIMPIVNYFNALVATGNSLNNYLTGFPTILQPVIAVLGNYLVMWGSIATTIYNVATALMSGDLAGAWQALITGLGSVVANYQTYIESLYTLLSGVGVWLATNLPIWGQMFVDWIRPYIPIALAMLATFGQSILTWISGQIAPYTVATQGWAAALVTWIQNAPSTVLGYLVGLGTSIVAWIVSEATALLSAFTTWYNALWSWVPAAIVQFLAAWPSMLNGFLDWIGSSVGPILAGFGIWLVGIIAWAAASAPKLLAALMKWGVEFTAWIAPQIPGMIVALAGLGAAILIWIAQTSVVIIAKLIEWGLAFLGWVGKNVLPALPGILMGIGNLIFEFIKGAAQIALTLAVGIGKGIIDGIKNADWGAIGAWIKEKVVGMLNAAKAALGIASPSTVFADQVGMPIVQGIVQGVTQTASLLDASMTGLLDNAVTGAQNVVNGIGSVLSSSQLPAKATTLGNTVIDNIAKALTNGTVAAMPEVNVSAQSIIDNIANTWESGDIAAQAKGVGSNAMKGVIAGIESKLGAAVSAAKSAAQKVVDAMASKLDIHSPSGVFASEIGVPIVLGIIQGLNATWPLVTHWLKGNMAKTVAEFLTSSATMVRGAYDIFKSLKDLQTSPPFQPLIDATDALKTAQDQALGVSSKLLDLNAEIAELQNTPLDQITDHVKYNEQLTALYAKQAILLNEQANAQANLANLGQTQAQAQAQSVQQQMMINQIADTARQQYEAAQQQALAMMATDAKGALAFFNQRKAQIEEMAQLEKDRALATSDEERQSLDTQIRLLQAAQAAETTAQTVTAQIQINPSGQSDQKILDIITRALRDAGIVVDIRTRTA